MLFEKTNIEGLQIITLPKFNDERGSFIKTFHTTQFEENDSSFTLKESYFSISHKNVIRGMHFQLPPYDHAKIVFCPHGSILDVIVDLRKASPTFGKFEEIILDADNHKAVFIPKGCAHGFASLADDTLTYYLVSSEYNPIHDTGILYNSFGKDWNIKNPILSGRDLSFITFANFASPF